MMAQWHIDINDSPVQTLMRQDETLAKLIRQIGNVEITLRPNPLKSLIRSIIGQQITNTAASAIFQMRCICLYTIYDANFERFYMFMWNLVLVQLCNGVAEC